ncbi:inositol monophosphatase [bacterium]|jgi:myo-inositol-1(or 4)-monophosphatase|nr:inositol monophosphatase [bacterium]MBT4250765.1 inositol monophosphatase [bacterium]MBT4598209.1 inositol monophosphatase [bacterium]MBT6753807.1 inositol monophosphatase [bacterium]MBT7037480.1 inositol monophosphatase [bacterium]
MEERKEFLRKIVREAGSIVLEKFENSAIEYTKDDKLDLVTDADLASNNFIVRKIKKTFPNDGIISEELDNEECDGRYTWVIDPLDGTINFATGIPIFVVMIALMKEGEVQMSAIFDPVYNKFAFAKKGEGAFVNDVKIQCSKEEKMTSSRGIMSSVVLAQEICLREKVIKKGEAVNTRMGVNAFGCAGFNAICVAEGKREWIVGFNTKLWDIAPSVLLLAEAGCKVTNHAGEEWRPGMAMVAANKELHKELVELTKGCDSLSHSVH